MKLPEYADLQSELDRGVELDSLDIFIYDNEPSLHKELWREQFVAAISHIIALPTACSHCDARFGCNELIQSTPCKARYFDYLNQ